MSITPDELDAFRDNFKFIGEELDGLKKTLGSESGDGLARERRQAARERRLLADEIRSSQNINAQAAEHLLNIESGIKEAQATFKALVEAANGEILQKERSAKTSTQLLQTRQADVEEQLATNGIRRLVVGHTPHGNCPTVIKSTRPAEHGPGVDVIAGAQPAVPVVQVIPISPAIEMSQHLIPGAGRSAFGRTMAPQAREV